MTDATPFDATMHSHRFSVWAAGRAASTKHNRFKVATLQRLLVDAEFGLPLVTPDDLPPPDELDRQHANWCAATIARADTVGLKLPYGQAAKIINVYHKARFCTGPWLQHAKVAALHPPIDRTLLRCLRNANFGGHGKAWFKFEQAGWSKFTYGQYLEVIDLMRTCMEGRPLWRIEQHWLGHQ